jgi:hypothetical protein
MDKSKNVKIHDLVCLPTFPHARMFSLSRAKALPFPPPLPPRLLLQYKVRGEVSLRNKTILARVKYKWPRHNCKVVLFFLCGEGGEGGGGGGSPGTF